jgi:hypothetical protein
VQEKLGVGDQQTEEGPKEDRMVEAKRPADHTLLGEGVEQHRPDASSYMAETVLRFAQGYEAETLITAPEEKQE